MLYKDHYCRQLNYKDFNIIGKTTVGDLLCRYLPFYSTNLNTSIFFTIFSIWSIYTLRVYQTILKQEWQYS